MPVLNARCNTCGTIFPSGIRVENSQKVSFGGGQFGPCPNCGRTGSLIASNTTLDVTGDQVTVTSGNLSPDDLRHIATSLSGFLGGNRSKEATEAAIAKALPVLAPEIQGMPLDQLLAVIAIILTMLGMVQAGNIADAATKQNQEIADAATRQNQKIADGATLQINTLIQEIRKLRGQQKSVSGRFEQHQVGGSEKQHDADTGDNPPEGP
jgi:hypothetical protein